MLRLFPLILGALGWLAMGTQGSLAADTVAPASTVTAPVAPLSTEQSDALVAELKLAGQSITESGQVPALGIAVVTSGKVLMAEGFGTTQVQSGTPVTDQTVFRLASVSKTLTAGLLALL
ncbi:MAG: serine hydrolase, partial [Xanthomonadales bacterium]|nr:serine hydrolase [Xanthomonadales bacterium]